MKRILLALDSNRMQVARRSGRSVGGVGAPRTDLRGGICWRSRGAQF